LEPPKYSRRPRASEAEGKMIMTPIEEIEKAIDALPIDEYRRLREWFLQRDWDAWDRQIEDDSASGKLDFLVKEAEEENRQGGLRPL